MDLLQLPNEDLQQIQAGHGQRLINLIIDNFASGLLFQIFSFFTNSIFDYESSIVSLISDRGSIFLLMIPYLFFTIMINIAYYGLSEIYLKGKTIGKLVTKTRAMSISGEFLSTKQVIYRSLVRLIPFEAFSALGSPCNPWHDRWTDSIVVVDNSVLKEKAKNN
jgi:uncharacterized RDD family membrane protein YckC